MEPQHWRWWGEPSLNPGLWKVPPVTSQLPCHGVIGEPCPVHRAPRLSAGPLQAAGDMGAVFGAWLRVKWRGGQRTPTQVRLQECPCSSPVACSHSPQKTRRQKHASANHGPGWGNVPGKSACAPLVQRTEFTSQTLCQSWVDMARSCNSSLEGNPRANRLEIDTVQA